jgi:hypothetical protein
VTSPTSPKVRRQPAATEVTSRHDVTSSCPSPFRARRPVLLSKSARVTAAIGNDYLAYWPNFRTFGDVLFSFTEHPGQRMVCATPVSAF